MIYVFIKNTNTLILVEACKRCMNLYMNSITKYV